MNKLTKGMINLIIGKVSWIISFAKYWGFMCVMCIIVDVPVQERQLTSFGAKYCRDIDVASIVER